MNGYIQAADDCVSANAAAMEPEETDVEKTEFTGLLWLMQGWRRGVFTWGWGEPRSYSYSVYWECTTIICIRPSIQGGDS